MGPHHPILGFPRLTLLRPTALPLNPRAYLRFRPRQPYSRRRYGQQIISYIRYP